MHKLLALSNPSDELFSVNFASISLTLSLSIVLLLTSTTFNSFLKSKRDRIIFIIEISLFYTIFCLTVFIQNILLFYAFWEILTFISYLLIGFYRNKNEIALNATKVWVISLIGSICILIGIFYLIKNFNTLNIKQLYLEIYSSQTGNNPFPRSIYYIIFGVLIKSSQLPGLYWLPKAIYAPIPASAILHSSTLVGIGIFLLSRIIPSGISINLLIFIASSSTLIGAFLAMLQSNTKKMLTFSTLSQIGLATVPLALGNSTLAIFHLIVHAIYKASLFICAGRMANILNTQEGISLDKAYDLRIMGKIYKYDIILFISYVISSLALIGFPGTSGFLSKKAITTLLFSWAEFQHYSFISIYAITCVLLAFCFSTVYIINTLISICANRDFFLKRKFNNNYLSQIKIVDILAILSLYFWYSNSFKNFSESWILKNLASIYSNDLTVLEKFQKPANIFTIICFILSIGILLMIQLNKGHTISIKNCYKKYQLDKLFEHVIFTTYNYITKSVHNFDKKIFDQYIPNFTIFYSKLASMTTTIENKILYLGKFLYSLKILKIFRFPLKEEKTLEYSLIYTVMFISILLLLKFI